MGVAFKNNINLSNGRDVMSFEDRSEAQRRNGEELETPRSTGDAIRHMRDKVRGFVEEVKSRNIGEAAGQAKDYVNEAAGQARDYVEATTVPGMFSDVGGLIKRYPLPALALGGALGFLVFRRRA